ncbi:MAG TPA: hypothetical protein VG452_09950 [Egibacteraceae bacterium]|nr:hypothetical protein [Egibacteraceae bacterium]
MADTEAAIHHASPIFVQIFQGPVMDNARARELYDQWAGTIAPGADGWLGSTAGVTDEGEFIAVVRFASGESARRSNERAEQAEWWQSMKEQFVGDVTFHDCTSIAEFGGGAWAHAGFVQIVQGWATDLRDVMELRFVDIEDHYTRSRHLQMAAGLVCDHADGGGFSEVIYFPSEKEARDPDSQELYREGVASLETLAQHVTNLRYLTLRDPWTSTGAGAGTRRFG